MAGSIIASSIGFALVGIILCEAVRNSRRQGPSKIPYHGGAVYHDFSLELFEPLRRGYDTPELQHEDILARIRLSIDRTIH